MARINSRNFALRQSTYEHAIEELSDLVVMFNLGLLLKQSAVHNDMPRAAPFFERAAVEGEWIGQRIAMPHHESAPSVYQREQKIRGYRNVHVREHLASTLKKEA